MSNQIKPDYKAFALAVMEAWPDGGIEGPDLEELAAKHNLLVPVIRFAACGVGCTCADNVDDAEFANGVKCFVRNKDDQTCNWELHTGTHKDWHPGCTTGVCFKDGHGPDDLVKPWKFCPYCGKPLEINKDDENE